MRQASPKYPRPPLWLYAGRIAKQFKASLQAKIVRRLPCFSTAKGLRKARSQSRITGIRESKGSQQGAVAVEFALVLPLFLLLIFGVMDFGLAMYSKGLITNASQEGARFGAIYRLSPLMVDDIRTHVQAYLQAAGFTDPVTVTITGAGGPSGSPLSVRVDYTYHWLTLPGLLSGFTGDLMLSAETVRRLE